MHVHTCICERAIRSRRCSLQAKNAMWPYNIGIPTAEGPHPCIATSCHPCPPRGALQDGNTLRLKRCSASLRRLQMGRRERGCRGVDAIRRCVMGDWREGLDFRCTLHRSLRTPPRGDRRLRNETLCVMNTGNMSSRVSESHSCCGLNAQGHLK
jgi:hypothetical protein